MSCGRAYHVGFLCEAFEILSGGLFNPTTKGDLLHLYMSRLHICSSLRSPVNPSIDLFGPCGPSIFTPQPCRMNASRSPSRDVTARRLKLSRVPLEYVLQTTTPALLVRNQPVMRYWIGLKLPPFDCSALHAVIATMRSIFATKSM